MNGRQRTVSDFFWRDPGLMNLSIEDKATLAYCLTSPSSNMIGVYPIVPNVCAAEMGWTAQQFSIVLARLDQLSIVRYDAKRSWVWVRIWWQHNQGTMALSPKLIERTLSQIRAIPDEWRNDWVADFAERCPQILGALDRVSIPYGYPSDRVSGNGEAPSASNVSKPINNASSPIAPRRGDSVVPAASKGYAGFQQIAEMVKQGGRL